MTDKTMLILPGKKVGVPKLLKRSLQVLASVILTGAVVLAVVLAANLLVARGKVDGLELWLGFIRRTDILATMVLTSLVTLTLVYWQRDQERAGPSAGSRPGNGR